MGIDNGIFIKIRLCSLLKSECQGKRNPASSNSFVIVDAVEIGQPQ